MRTVSVNSALRRIRDAEGRIRHSAGRGPCACGRRGRRVRPGCACAAGNHASSRGADYSAGTCAYSLRLQVRDLDTGRLNYSRAVLGITTGYHLEHRRLPGVPRCRDLGCGKLFSQKGCGHAMQRGCHVHNMWIVLWIVSAARDAGMRGERTGGKFRPGRGMGTIPRRASRLADPAASAGLAEAHPAARAGGKHRPHRDAERVRQGTAGDQAACADHPGAVSAARPRHPARRHGRPGTPGHDARVRCGPGGGSAGTGGSAGSRA